MAERTRRHRRDDRGSALLLAPAGVLVLIVLGAIAADSAVVLLAERELAGAAAAAANDAATAAIDDNAFYVRGELRLDADRARTVAAQSVAARAPAGVKVDSIDIVVNGRRVCVSVEGTTRHWFAPSVPGAQRTTQVAARAVATAATADDPGGDPPITC